MAERFYTDDHGPYGCLDPALALGGPLKRVQPESQYRDECQKYAACQCCDDLPDVRHSASPLSMNVAYVGGGLTFGSLSAHHTYFITDRDMNVTK